MSCCSTARPPLSPGRAVWATSLNGPDARERLISVSGKRNFEARDKGAEIALGSRCGHSQRPSARAPARQFGRFRQKPGKSTHRDPAPARKPVNSAGFAKSREISVRRRLRGGAGRSPTLGEINGLQMVRVEITPLNAKEDFAATRTLRRSRTS
jgi:hypothetical protein